MALERKKENLENLWMELYTTVGVTNGSLKIIYRVCSHGWRPVNERWDIRGKRAKGGDGRRACDDTHPSSCD